MHTLPALLTTHLQHTKPTSTLSPKTSYFPLLAQLDVNASYASNSTQSPTPCKQSYAVTQPTCRHRQLNALRLPLTTVATAAITGLEALPLPLAALAHCHLLEGTQGRPYSLNQLACAPTRGTCGGGGAGLHAAAAAGLATYRHEPRGCTKGRHKGGHKVGKPDVLGKQR